MYKGKWMNDLDKKDTPKMMARAVIVDRLDDVSLTLGQLQDDLKLTDKKMERVQAQLDKERDKLFKRYKLIG